jgi:tetratricopeptide (TPR) repeat protein
MPIITIAQKTTLDNAFEATLTIGDSLFEIRVSDPFAGDKREKALEWYFEEWIRFSQVDGTIAARAAKSVKEYGVTLFEQVFGPEANSAYQRASGKLSKLEILIEGDPEFQGLHWEAMWDKEMSRPLAVDCVMVRQRAVRGRVPLIEREESETLNLLVVTARPGEEKDVGYRTISRLLVEGISNARVPVNVELVRPGTYEAFVKELASKPEGYYHVVHFDMHGCVMSFEQLTTRLNDDNDYTFQRGYDLPDFASYEGMKAFLLFETDQAGHAMPVSAQEMSDLLKYHGIPVCILNACQSGKQLREGETDSFDARETSLGARLIDAGVQTVIAMAYSVTVDAARLMVENLYRNLFEQMPIDRALQRARRELHARKERKVSFGQKVDLEDWLLPVVYRNQAVDLKLRQMSPEEKKVYSLQQGKRLQFLETSRTEYGFVGRDLDILKLEKGLIRNCNMLMLCGMGGTGKTTLLRYLQDWWVQTGFVEGVSYFGYDQRAWNLGQILFNVAQDVMSEEDLRSFQSQSLVEQLGDLVPLLKGRQWLVVLDNLESVTGQALAIANTLTTAEQEEIRSFLGMLRDGQTRVVLGSRRREEWLSSVYGENEYELRGLDDLARTELAQKVLERHVKDRATFRSILVDKDFAQLMKLLAGYPLAIEVVLSNLGRQSVTEVLAGLDAGNVDLDRVGNKTESILQCVEYSHGNLSVSAQRSLLCLALFSGFVIRGLLEQYVDELKKLELFQDYRFEDLDTAVTEAINWGLLTPHEMGIPDLLTIQPVFPYFLKTKLALEDGEFREALRLGFKNHYEGLAESYNQMMESKEPQERQLGIMFCKFEYENLYAGLQIALERQENFTIFRCLDEYLNAIGDFKQCLELCDVVCEITANYPLNRISNQIALRIIETYLKLGNCHIQLKDYAAARTDYLEGIQRTEKLSNIDKLSQQSTLARLYQQLGRVAHELREFEQAQNDYKKALQIYIEFNDRYSQAVTYHQLGLVAHELREFEQARNNYNQALQIKIEFNNRYSQASTYHQLGMVAQKLDEFEQARKDYKQALQIFIEFNDRYSQASTYHQLGIIAQKLREFEQARNDYQRALQIRIEFNDRYSQARTYYHLGIVAQELHEFEQARNDYQRALQICIEFNDRYSQARTYNQLGALAEAKEQPEEAILQFCKALIIFDEFQDSHSSAMSFQNIIFVYQSYPSPQLLSAITQSLNMSETEVLRLFERVAAGVAETSYKNSKLTIIFRYLRNFLFPNLARPRA